MAEDPKQPIGETPTEPPQSAAAPVTPPVQPPAAPAEPEEFDKDRAMATIKAQREQEKQLKAQLKDYERLKAEEQKRVEAAMTETEKLQKQTAELAAQNARLQGDILRRDVIAETGLPAVFADRLKGETKDEMLADAKELLKVLPAEKPKPPHLNNTSPNNANTAETDTQKRERLFGPTSQNIWDLESIKKLGGGVIYNKEK